MKISSNPLTPLEVARYYAARYPNLKQRGPEWRAACLIHNGKDPNFSVKAETGEWYCHSQCNRGGSVYDFEMELTGAGFREAAAEVRRLVGRPENGAHRAPEADPQPDKAKLPPWSKKYLAEKIQQVAEHEGLEFIEAYPYHYADKRLAWAKVRFVDKDGNKTFRSYAVTPKGGWTSPTKAGVPPLLYRLPEVMAAAEVDLLNGEKAANAGVKLGRATTCGPNGEGHWEPEFTEQLTGKTVNIFTDNDNKGCEHGRMVARELFGKAKAVRLIKLPGLPPKGDLYDWIEAGGTAEQLHQHIEQSPFLDTPPAEEAPAPPHSGARVEQNTPSVFQNLAPYPAPLGEDAYYGIAGRFVHLVEPHTEADPSFMLIQFLAYAGNIMGRRAFVWAGADRHYSNIFICGVGPTSSGRKGSAAGPCQLFFKDVDEDWVKAIQSGLSSGEGLIWCVRDPIYRREKVSQGKGKPAEYDDVLIDPGVADKRLLVQQSEFFGALQAMRRTGNNLSPTMRDAFDKGHLNSMIKNSPAKATDAHITIVGNITKEELLRGMLIDEMDNGFANRFLWVCSRRSKCLPEGGRMWEIIQGAPFQELQKDFNRIHYAVEGALRRDADAADIWGYDDRPDTGVYRELTEERHGMYGACTARAAAITLRVSLIYALLDGAREIRKEHLLAALEVWRYCDDSAKYIFGDATGDSTADEILRALRASPGGLNRTEINALFDRHKSVSELSRALLALHSRGLIRFEIQKTKGRPVEKWFAVWQSAPAPVGGDKS
jgi:hypothetical protein